MQLFFMSKWLVVWIAGACAQRRRRRRRTTWRPYSFLPLIPSFSLQLSSLIFDIHVTNDSRCWSNVLETGLHWSKKIKITTERKTELTGKEDRERGQRESGPALGKEAKQYWTMPWIIARNGLEKGGEIIPNNAVKIPNNAVKQS